MPTRKCKMRSSIAKDSAQHGSSSSTKKLTGTPRAASYRHSSTSRWLCSSCSTSCTCFTTFCTSLSSVKST